MSDIAFRPASERELTQWDDFVESAFNGTLFHLRAFLGYHGERFAGAERWLVAAKGDSAIARIAYAVQESDDGQRRVLSPYGASYGGFVLHRAPSYSEASDIAGAFIDYLLTEKVDECRLIHPIACCNSASLDVMIFALREQGFTSVVRDISTVVDFSEGAVDEIVGSRARNMERKARRAGVEVVHRAPLDAFWIPMEATYSRHNALPTHSPGELELLCRELPDAIWTDVAYLNDEPVGGICYFRINDRVMSSFYFCQTQSGREVQSLSMLVMEGLRRAQQDGYRYFDFGTSSINNKARPAVFRFKESFSKQGYFRETLAWKQQ